MIDAGCLVWGKPAPDLWSKVPAAAVFSSLTTSYSSYFLLQLYQSIAHPTAYSCSTKLYTKSLESRTNNFHVASGFLFQAKHCIVGFALFRPHQIQTSVHSRFLSGNIGMISLSLVSMSVRSLEGPFDQIWEK